MEHDPAGIGIAHGEVDEGEHHLVTPLPGGTLLHHLDQVGDLLERRQRRFGLFTTLEQDWLTFSRSTAGSAAPARWRDGPVKTPDGVGIRRTTVTVEALVGLVGRGRPRSCSPVGGCRRRRRTRSAS